MARSKEPFFWVLFTAGGMLAALILPALVLLLWFAIPLGWLAGPAYAELVAKVQPPLIRLCLFVLLSFSLFHWGHRFRYTLYDGLQLEHLYGLIAIICYGGATVLTAVTAYVLWTF
ncbi:MAG TPA: fumarate reductase subunit FrdD [Thermoanaerobaculia bacterium]